MYPTTNLSQITRHYSNEPYKRLIMQLTSGLYPFSHLHLIQKDKELKWTEQKKSKMFVLP